MVEMWRVIDTGLRSAAQNIALDRALLEARNAEEIPSTLRFYRVAPAVLLASRHSAGQESDGGFCAEAAITVQRRITGGDTVYCDGGQLGWALYLHQRDVETSDMQAVARRVCHAVATALAALGVDARYRAPHDVEVEGRRIVSAGGVCEGAALLYQGVIYFDLDLPTLLKALRTPAVALGDGALAAARGRIGDLTAVLGECPRFALVKDRLVAAFESEFATELHDAELSLTEHARYQSALAEIDTPGWINLVDQPAMDVVVAAASHEYADGGALTASMLHDRARQRIKQVWFTGELSPAAVRALAELETVLCSTSVDRLERNVLAWFAARALSGYGPTAFDLISLLRRALQLPLVVPNP